MSMQFGDLNYALVKNVGDERAILTWNSVPFIIEPGDIEPVPFEAVCNWCGDPRSANDSQIVKVQGGENRWIPSRMEERRRLRQLYGMHDAGDEYEIIQNGKTPKLEVKWRQKRVYTVLEDPEGVSAGVSVVNQLSAANQVTMQVQMEHLKDQLRILQARFEGGTASPQDRDFIAFTEQELPQDEAIDPTTTPLPHFPTNNVDWDSAIPQYDE